MKKTLIESLIEKGYDSKKAKSLLMAGNVKVNDEVETLPNMKVLPEDIISIKEQKEYVSRGAYKLLEAIKLFSLNFDNKVILDIGSSTGGFTQVAIQNGAKHVYSLDSGTNQLDYSLRVNPRVTSLEKTNLKEINKELFKHKIDFAVCDVSFISSKNVFKVLSEQLDNIPLMLLIKPQFEANSNQVEEGGFVPESLHKEIIEKVLNYAKEFGYYLSKIDKSPIEGGVSKNIEYISLFEKESNE